MASVTINSHTYTDDANPTTGLGGGGHRARFIPLISDVVTVLGTVAANGSLTINRALASNASGQVVAASVTSTELGYLSGVTSTVQTQLNEKAPIIGPSFYGTVGQQGPFIFSKYGENSVIVARRANGTVENPTIALGDETLGQFAAYGYKGGGNWHYAGGIASVADADWETTSKASLRFYTGSGGASSHKMTLNTAGNLLIGTATDDASGAKLQVASSVNLAAGNAYKINNVQVVGARQAAIANASVSYTTGNLDTEAEIITALNTTNGKINSILAALRTHGLIAP